MDTSELLSLGSQSTVVAVVALYCGYVLERLFANTIPYFAPVQIACISVIYLLLKANLQFGAEAWIVFAPCVFSTQPSLLVKMKSLLGI